MIIISPETTVPEVSPVYKAISVPLWHTLFCFFIYNSLVHRAEDVKAD